MAVYSPKEITDNYIEAAIGKATAPLWRLFLLGIFAGVLIAIGAIASSTAAHSVADAGTVRFVSGAIFPIGLIMVVLLGAELFTGNSLMVTAVCAKRITWAQLLRNWVVVYIGNFVGALCMAALMANFGQLDIGAGALAVYTAKVAASKSTLTWVNAFVLGIFCNVLVCISIYVANTAQDTTGKILGLFVPVFGFVIAGFEHCVANMYYIPAGIFAAMNPAYAPLLAEANINTAVLNFATFFTANLIPVTLGNIVGGMAVGLLMYATHGTKRGARATQGTGDARDARDTQDALNSQEEANENAHTTSAND